MPLWVYDSLANRKKINKLWKYIAPDTRKEIQKIWVYDSAANRKLIYSSAPPNVLSGTMVAGTSSNFVGFSKAPSSPTFGSCSPIPSIGNYTLCYCGSISINAELECSFTGLTDPGQLGLFTTFNDGLGNARPASAAVYVWNNTSKIARWRFTTAAVDYVNGSSYNLSFVI